EEIHDLLKIIKRRYEVIDIIIAVNKNKDSGEAPGDNSKTTNLGFAEKQCDKKEVNGEKLKGVRGETNYVFLEKEGGKKKGSIKNNKKRLFGKNLDRNSNLNNKSVLKQRICAILMVVSSLYFIGRLGVGFGKHSPLRLLVCFSMFLVFFFYLL
ncbi:hypothetical protein CDIK_4079, partial [Cucumispora dikerogammari]